MQINRNSSKGDQAFIFKWVKPICFTNDLNKVVWSGSNDIGDYQARLKTLFLSNYVDLIYTETDGIFVSEDYRLPLACSFPQSYQGPV